MHAYFSLFNHVVSRNPPRRKIAWPASKPSSVKKKQKTMRPCKPFHSILLSLRSLLCRLDPFCILIAFYFADLNVPFGCQPFQDIPYPLCDLLLRIPFSIYIPNLADLFGHTRLGDESSMTIQHVWCKRRGWCEYVLRRLQSKQRTDVLNLLRIRCSFLHLKHPALDLYCSA